MREQACVPFGRALGPGPGADQQEDRRGQQRDERVDEPDGDTDGAERAPGEEADLDGLRLVTIGLTESSHAL
jgi:hypothetical protein